VSNATQEDMSHSLKGVLSDATIPQTNNSNITFFGKKYFRSKLKSMTDRDKKTSPKPRIKVPKTNGWPPFSTPEKHLYRFINMMMKEFVIYILFSGL